MVKVNEVQVKKVAEVLKSLTKREVGLNFYGFQKGDKEIIANDMYPPLNHPQAINFFFFCCLHQHGFWYGDEKGYVGKFYGIINDKKTGG
ncbi:hypothetical protein ACFLZ9_00115, partial [Patescibacteria group bacterium]